MCVRVPRQLDALRQIAQTFMTAENGINLYSVLLPSTLIITIPYGLSVAIKHLQDGEY